MWLVSACLLGVYCRYDGGHSLVPELVSKLRQGEKDHSGRISSGWIPVCPEQLGGLPTPRPAAEIVGGTGLDVLTGQARVVARPFGGTPAGRDGSPPELRSGCRRGTSGAAGGLAALPIPGESARRADRDVTPGATPPGPTEKGEEPSRATGQDVTGAFLQGARQTLHLARLTGASGAILKEKSPSCGVHRIYDGSFRGNLVTGLGVTAALLQQEGFEVLSEEEFLRTSQQ